MRVRVRFGACACARACGLVRVRVRVRLVRVRVRVRLAWRALGVRACLLCACSEVPPSANRRWLKTAATSGNR